MGVIEQFLARPVPNVSFTQIVIGIGGIFLLYRLAIIFYRLFLSPLRHIPGPKLAAATTMYQAYWDIVKGGTFCFHVPEVLHPKYGPIIRVGPNRVRLTDIASFQTVHKIGTKFYKDEAFYNMFGFPSLINDPSNEHHRQRRIPFASSFGPSEVRKQEPLVREKLDRLLNKIDEMCAETGEATFNIDYAVMCMALEVFFQFSFGKEVEKYIDIPNFEADLCTGGRKFMDQNIRQRTFPTFYSKVVPALPMWLQQIVAPYAVVQRSMGAWGGNMVREYEKEYFKLKQEKAEKKGGYTYLDGVLDAMQEGEHLSDDFCNDATFVFLASFSTVAALIDKAIIAVAADARIRAKLLAEIDGAYDTQRTKDNGGYIDNETATNLPYLTAVLKETLRLAFAVSGTLPRVVPPGGATLSNHFLPAGTIIEHSVYTLQTTPSIFPDPFKFNPERWLVPPEQIAHMEKYIITFGAGSRICLGMNLGIMQLNVTVANFLRRFEVVLNPELEGGEVRFVDRWGSLVVSCLDVTCRPRKVE